MQIISPHFQQPDVASNFFYLNMWLTSSGPSDICTFASRMWRGFFYSVWVRYSVSKTILSAYLFLPQYSIFSEILVCWAHAYNFTCTLSIRLRIVCICSAYAYELYAYAQHMLTNCMHMLSIRVQKNIEIVWIILVCWVYAYCMRMLSIGVQIVCICSVYV